MIEKIFRARNELVEYGLKRGIMVTPTHLSLHPKTYYKLRALATSEYPIMYYAGERADTFLSMELDINPWLSPNTIVVEDKLHRLKREFIMSDYDMEDNIMDNRLFSSEWFKPATNLPKRYIVNDKACILFYDDKGKDKVVVKRCKDDKSDPIKAFLWAYFEKTSGLSKTKANKYLAKVEENYKTQK